MSDERKPDEPAGGEPQAAQEGETQSRPPNYWNAPVDGETRDAFIKRVNEESQRRAARIGRWLAPRYRANKPTLQALVMLLVHTTRTLGLDFPPLLRMLADQWERAERAEQRRIQEALNAAMLAAMPTEGKPQ